MIHPAATHMTDQNVHSCPASLHEPTDRGTTAVSMHVSPFGDILDDRTQQTLADMAGVSRRFLIDLEAGHNRAELGKTLAVLTTLGLTLAATDPIPHGSDFDPARRDYAATFTRLIAERDFEFATKMLADYATASLAADRPLLQRSPRLKDRHWTAALAGITNYTAHRLGQHAPAWTHRIKPLDDAWMPAQSYRTIREPMKQLTISETPNELAALNVFIRERSLATT
jgi:hypothetical protein